MFCNLPTLVALIVGLLSTLSISLASVEENFEKGLQLGQERKYNEAIAAFTEVIQADANHISAYIEMARSLTLVGKRKDGLKQLDIALPLAKKNIDKLRIREQRRLLSEIFFTNTTFQKYQDGLNNMKGMKLRAAIESFEQALAQEGDNVEILTSYAKALQAVDDWKESTNVLEQAFSLNPERKETRILLATVLLQNNQDRTIQLLEPMQNDPNKSETAVIIYAQALAKKGKIKEAINTIQNSVEHKPEWLRALYWLGKFSHDLPENNWIARKHLQTFIRRIESIQKEDDLKFLEIEAKRILSKIQVNLGLENTR